MKRLGFAVVLSWAVLFNTLLVTTHNLGARDDIGYINGGKVFRLTGTMWYHLPGLQEIGLAPQNIGAKINLRNNEFAMLERDLNSVEQIDVEFGLAENALLLVILDRHREGTFWAVRLTAFSHEGTPFINALVRYDRGRVTQRIPLTELGAQLDPGDHAVSVALSGGQLKVTVDGKAQTLPFAEEIRPGLALGCGELNTTIHTWHVIGTTEDGERFEWAETFSILDTLSRRLTPLILLTTLLWLLLFGLPLLKVLVENRIKPTELLPAVLLNPLPRTIFAVVCLFPFMSMMWQWVLGGLYVFYAWMTLWEELAKGKKTWAVPGESGGVRWRWGAVGGVLLIASAATFWGAASVRNVIGTGIDGGPPQPQFQVSGMKPLGLGERIELDVEGKIHQGTRVTFDIELGENEVVRADLLRSSPPRTADVYQVDRSQDSPEDRERAPEQEGEEGKQGGGEEEGHDPGDYELLSASCFFSTDPDLPGNLRKLVADKSDGSPYAGWMLTPGAHKVEMVSSDTTVWVAVDGKIVDQRTDMPPGFLVGGVQLLSTSRRVKRVGNLTVEEVAPDGVGPLAGAVIVSDVLGVVGQLLLVFGLGTLLILGATRLGATVSSVRSGLLKIARAHTLVWLWLGWFLLERAGVIDLAQERTEILIGVIPIMVGMFNMAQLVRHTDETRPMWLKAVGVALLLLLGVGTFEGLSSLYPERRHSWTHYWNYQLGPRYFWEHDPMIRRLNPWFIDQRFKRRDYKPEHPDKVRVVVFGGSQTYGWGIPAMDRMTFSDQLERALHKDGYKGVEVLNAAFPGVKTATGLRWFAGNLLRYEPDIVVINFVVNEFMNVDQFHVWSGDRKRDDSLSSLATLALLERWRGNLMGNHLSQIIVADVYEIYAMEQYLRWWHQIATERGVKLVFSIEPTNLYVESGGNVIMREETHLGNAQDLYRKLGKELDVPVYDVLPHFQGEQENVWFYDTMHMSRLGHRVFAENLAKLVAASYLAPK